VHKAEKKWKKREKAELMQAEKIMMMMMILHQVQHGRQDNHATNHVRCAETSRAKQSRKHIEAKHSKTIYLSTCASGAQRLPS
jgi:hypothetical protein